MKSPTISTPVAGPSHITMLLVPPASIESGNASASKPKSSKKQQLTLKPTVSETGVSKPKSSEKQQLTLKPTVSETGVSKPKSSEKQQLTLKPTVSETGVSKPKSSEKQQSTWSKCCNQFAAHNNLQGTCLVVQVDSALHPFGGAKSSTGFGWGKLGNVTSAGWQVTLCDPIWHTSSRSSEA